MGTKKKLTPAQLSMLEQFTSFRHWSVTLPHGPARAQLSHRLQFPVSQALPMPLDELVELVEVELELVELVELVELFEVELELVELVELVELEPVEPLDELPLDELPSPELELAPVPPVDVLCVPPAPPVTPWPPVPAMVVALPAPASV